MCGIVGVAAAGAVEPDALIRMRNTLLHRGPNQAGHWIQDNVGLAHQRLSIIDTSSAATQPLLSSDERWVLSFNGEVYNFETLRKELPDKHWRSQSDTEVLLEAIATWGVPATLPKLNGMFAFAAFDRQTKKLYLARDAVGIKPLYLGVVGDAFYFASELNALRHLPQLRISHHAMDAFLRYRYVPTPDTIFEQISKLPPGHWVCIDTQAPTQLPSPEPFWDLQSFAQKPKLALDIEDAESQLDQLLHEAIDRQLVSDVPIGAFLSGGIDSSLVCAIASQHTSKPLRTFSIGFDDPRLDEAPQAKAIAQHLGCDHTELYVSEKDLLASIEQLPNLCDEPFADSSILPTYLVSKMTAEHVTVALSGDGGDELFWGYTRYPTTERIWRRLASWPVTARAGFARLFRAHWLQSAANQINNVSLGGRRGSLGQKLAAAGEFMDAQSPADLYQQLVCHWRRPSDVLRPDANQHKAPTTPEHPSVYANPHHWTRQHDLWSQMAWQDFLAYLPDDVLTKVDRASMRVSLEARVPILDMAVVEFAQQLPGHFKYAESDQKHLLKRVLARYLPASLYERPKAGFGVPLDTWLRGPLKEWAADLLHSSTAQTLFYQDVLERYWQAHLSGNADNSAKLWDVLMLLNWHQERP